MISKKNILIIVISLAAGGLLTWWLYVRFHVLFFVIFIPIVTFGIPAFRKLLSPEGEKKNDEEKQNGGGYDNSENQ